MRNDSLSCEKIFINRDYREIRQIGRGGDGTVYLVFHKPTEQMRAAKCFRTENSQRRLQELMLIKRLRHSALPQVLDICIGEQQIWLIMEYINGRNISEIPCEERSMIQFFSIASQLSEILIYLHTRPCPILHLDLKPTNVLLRQDGSLVLIDFGAAILEAWGETQGHYGTPGFAAPEQKQQGKRIDVRADIYGYGALLYFYLCEKRPVVAQTKKMEWNSPWQKRCKRGVRQIVERCLSPEPEGRFTDFQEVQKAFALVRLRYHWYRRMQKSIGVVVFLAVVLGFAWSHLLYTGMFSEIAVRQNRKKYDLLLERSEALGFSLAVGCFEEAVKLCPGRNEWCFLLLERIGSDYIFDEGEEEAVRKLIYTVLPGEERTFLEYQKSTNNPAYRELAYRMGMLYWYFYSGTGGKRAAANWFEAAVDLQRKQVESGEQKENKDTCEQESAWLESAKIHAEISGYYERLGKRDAEGVSGAKYSSYWEDLKRLWALDSLEKEGRGVQLHVADELLGCMLFHMQEICESGESFETVKKLLELLENFFQRTGNEMEATDVEKAKEQCNEARASIMRVYERIGGTVFEK